MKTLRALVGLVLLAPLSWGQSAAVCSATAPAGKTVLTCGSGGSGTTSPVSSEFVFGSAAGATNAVAFNETAGCITFEGATADASEDRLCVADPTADIVTTIPTLAVSQTLAIANTSLNTWVTQTIPTGERFEFGTVGAALSNGFLTLRAEDTPDTLVLAGPATSNHVLLVEGQDAGFDFAHAQATDPTLFVHSHNQSTTQWIAASHNATDGVVSTGAGNLKLAPASGAIWGVQTKALTESAATSFVQIAVAASTSTGGAITYSIEADDATDFQSRSGVLPFAIVNKAGTETCTVGTVGAATEVVAVSAGTLTNTFTCSTSPANAVDIQANAVSSLTQTTLRINYMVQLAGNASNTVTPQ